MLYDKEIYDDYVDSVMGITKKDKQEKNNPLGYGAASPINTFGNKEKYGSEAWKNTTNVLYNEAINSNPNALSDLNKVEVYEFFGTSLPKSPLADYGIRTGFNVSGNARKINANELVVSVSAKGDPSMSFSGSVKVTQNGMTYSNGVLNKSSNGYIYSTGGVMPIGEVYVDLPKNNPYEVELNVFGNIYETGSNNTTTFKKKLPIYEKLK